eukprot:CAMPEP_0176432356 /NCGR_PEP_ID=MMETSP0127-20121128/15349_1 /TAXON_ID=938130 /ORGANISM="Platyophrya macrostoma, Strain WH" /LENGTH=381 /DNA_ID=CAMNT_0017814519 /DNA_START=25 /DNA_END=1170 /DNA_ORIENTATION=-
MESEKEKREYIRKNVNPVLERMVVDILVSRPDDLLNFMINWLQSKGPKYISGNKSVVVNDDEKSDEDEDEEDEVLEITPEVMKKAQGRGNRGSVSAEAYGLWNKKGSYVPKVVPKTEDQKDRIRGRLAQAFMFQALDEKEQQIVVDAMEEVKFPKGSTVIQQGDSGDVLYVVDSGALDCFKRFKKDEDEKYLKQYQPGESFGELALLYNAPRAATIRAAQDSILFSLDRECFNNIVKDSAVKKREQYESLLSKIDLLSTMDGYERSKIADALKHAKFRAGEYVVKEGENGNTFFFIEEGEAVATKTLKAGSEPEVVFEYKSGDYFGELALLKDIPRQANIVAKTDLVLASMDRLSFKRLIGPLEELLKRNFAKYEKFSQLK